MNHSQKQALQYVKNTGGGATKEIFVDDHEPIGDILWEDIQSHRWVEVREDGKIYLTEDGQTQLEHSHD